MGGTRGSTECAAKHIRVTRGSRRRTDQIHRADRPTTRGACDFDVAIRPHSVLPSKNEE
jgi:hypothetical protein